MLNIVITGSIVNKDKVSEKANIQNKLSKDTDFLIKGNTKGLKFKKGQSKVSIAERMNIKVISEDEFFKMVSEKNEILS